MKAELVKRQDRWDLYGEDGSKIASSAPNPFKRLSIKNCEAIANGYDLDELVKNMGKEFYVGGNYDFENGVKEGFLKALKILGDKKFSEEQLKVAADWYFETKGKKSIDEYIQSLQQTEWDVEIVTEPYVKYVSRSLHTVYPPLDIQNKLDKDGCLILKRL